MAYLVVKQLRKEVCRLELKSATRIGRSRECELSLLEPYLSRQHLRLERVGKHWEAVDLASKHGTFVNSRRITRKTLRDGDVLKFGSFVVRFHLGALLPERFETPNQALFAAKVVADPPVIPRRAWANAPTPQPQYVPGQPDENCPTPSDFLKKVA